MKKGKVFGKRQVLLAVMVLSLAVAVWLNMKYTATDIGPVADNVSTDTHYLGEATYVNTDKTENAVATNGKVSESIESAKKERNETREKTMESLKNTINNASLDEAQKNAALNNLGVIAGNIDKELAIETILKAKGLTDCLVVASEDNVTVMVAKDKLLDSETLQIQDAVTTQTGLSLEKIKIISVK